VLPARRLVLATLVAALAVLSAPGCDFTPTLDIETPPYAPGLVVRSVLAAGQMPTVRVSVSRDPYGPTPTDGAPPPSVTPEGVVVTLLRDGAVVETLAPRAQTCYGSQTSTCNASTGQTETVRNDPYRCDAFVGQMPVEAGATYTLRATLDGLPPAEATVTVPVRPTITVEGGAASDPARRRVRVHLPDLPGAASRFSFALQREFSSYRTSVCRVGGPRDTTITLANPARTGTDFTTDDAVLLAGAREPSGILRFVTFTDATFEGGTFSFDVDAAAEVSGLVSTGRFTVQVAALSQELYDAYELTAFALGDDNPFAEPVNLPSNVVGGYGRVGAAAVVEATASTGLGG